MLESKALSPRRNQSRTPVDEPAALNPNNDMKEPFFIKRKTLVALGPELRTKVFEKLEKESDQHLNIPQDASIEGVLDIKGLHLGIIAGDPEGLLPGEMDKGIVGAVQLQGLIV